MDRGAWQATVSQRARHEWSDLACTHTQTIMISSGRKNNINVVVQLLSCVWLFVTLWTAACQASLCFTISWSLLKFLSIALQHSLASLVAQMVKNLPLCGMPGLDPWVGKIPRTKERLPTPVFWPGAFHGLYSPWGHHPLDTTEELLLSAHQA